MSNSIENKRVAKNTLFLYLRSIILMIINLYTSRVVLQALGVEDYGIYNVVGGVVGLFSLLSGTLAAASQRFITYTLGENDAKKIKTVFINCISLHFILGLIIIFLLEIIGVWLLYHQLNIPEGRLIVANIVLQCSIFTSFFGVISVPYNALIVAHERMSAFAYIGIIEGVLKLLIAIYLLNCSFDKLIVYAILHLVVSIMIRLIYSIYSSRNFIEARKISFRIDGLLFKKMFTFAGWNLMGQGAMVLRNQGIDILLNIFFGVTINAAKGICNQVQYAIIQFSSNFSTSIRPQLTMSIAQKNYQRTHSLVFHGSRLYYFMMMIFTVPLIVVSKEVLELWLVDVPEFAVSMVAVSLVYVQSNTLSKLLVTSILAHGDIRNFQLFAGGMKLMALPVTYVILRIGGSPLTGIWVNIALDFCCRAIELYFMHRLLYYDFLKNYIMVEIPCWFTFGISLLLSTLFYRQVSNNLFIAGCVSLLLVLICIWVIGLNKQEKQYLLQFANKVTNKRIKR